MEPTKLFTPVEGDRPLGIDRKWWVLLAVGCGTFMSALDSSVANIILPVLSRVFSADVAVVEWVVTVYLLVVSGVLLSFGRLGDLRSHKQIYILGFFIFVFGSASCGLSPSIPLLIGSRVVQSLGAAMLFANSPAILTSNFLRPNEGRHWGCRRR